MTTWNLLLARSATLANRLRQERGQALVEFAVVLPILLLIVMGIIFFGRYESYSSQMTQLAEVGARDSAVFFVPTTTNGGACQSAPTTASLACYIQNQASGELASGSPDVKQVSVTVDCNPGSTTDMSCSPGDNVAVCVQTTVQFPFLPVKAGTIYQVATMRVETPGAGNSQTLTPLPAPSC
jgi:Flp pilus assembly protein TadG